MNSQVSSHLETLSYNTNFYSRNYPHDLNASQEGQHESQEVDDHQSPDSMMTTDGSTSVQISNPDVPDQGNNRLVQVSEDDGANQYQSGHDDPDVGTRSTVDGTGRNWPESSASDEGQPQTREAHLRRTDGSHESMDNWSERPSDPPRIPPSVPYRRVTRFHPPDDDSVYSMELRELLGRYIYQFWFL